MFHSLKTYFNANDDTYHYFSLWLCLFLPDVATVCWIIIFIVLSAIKFGHQGSINKEDQLSRTKPLTYNEQGQHSNVVRRQVPK